MSALALHTCTHTFSLSRLSCPSVIISCVWLRNPGTYLKMLLVCGIRVTDRIWVYMYHGKSCPLARFLYKNGKSFGPSEKATTPPYEWLAYAHRAAVLGPYLRPVPVTNRTEHFSRAISITERRALEPAGDPRAF